MALAAWLGGLADNPRPSMGELFLTTTWGRAWRERTQHVTIHIR